MNRRILIGFVIVLVFVFFFAKPTSVDAQFTVAGGVYTLAPQPPRTNQSGPMTLRDLRNLIHRNGALGSKWWKKPNVSFASSLDPNATLDAALIGRQVAAEAAARFLRDAQNRADNARWVRQETEHVVSAEEDTAVDPEAVYEVLAESTPPTQLVSPCLVANCPRKAYTAFRHYELCRSAVDGLVHWKLNNSAMDLSAAARLKPKVDGPALRTKNEKLTDGTCDGKTQTPNGHITRSGLADCIDPRWPLRLPLTLHRLSSGTTLSCYARGDMVCDIVGRSGGWEAELLSILSGSLATMRASGVRRLSYWREKRYTQLEDVFGRAAVQDAIDRIANSSSRHAELALRPPGANSPFASTAEEMDDILRNDELALRRMPGRTLAAGTFKPKPQDNGEAEPGAMTREERLNFQYGRGDNIYAHELMYDVRRLRPPQVTRGNFGVEYLDIGANVGAFILHLWRSGFPSIAFEALPYNMQLLSTTLCVNGLRHMRGGLGTPSVVQTEPGLDDEPSVTVHYTALGREKDLRCVMMSEDLNFGDTWISCNATHVESTEEFPFQKYRRRGFVNMTRLDSLTTGSTNKLRHESKQRRRAAEIVRHELEAVEAVLIASNASAPSLPPMTPLSESFFRKDYIMKIDVEGHEIAVMQGATDFLRSPQRPKMILSEIWKSLNITQYAEVMMSAGYHAVMPFAGIYATTVAGMSNYKSELRLNMDTIIWVLPQWRHRLLPLFSNFEDAAVAHNIGSSERVKW